MALILGIDTGGTFTDAVVFSSDTEKIIRKSKAFTTKADLSEGIANAIDYLDFDEWDKVSKVHLSTTLATNSILEKKIANVGLILCGNDIRGNADIMCSKKILLRDVSAESMMDLTILDSIRNEFSSSIDAVVISSANGGNTEEMHIAEMLRRILGVPVYCATTFSESHNYYVRTVTGVLNTGLIPIISDWISCIKKVLDRKGIAAEMFIMRGDGKMTNAAWAQSYPITTIMSGPAASASGALFLTDLEDFLLLDMGGTSADVTKIENRMLRRKKSVTLINDLPVSTSSLDIQSFPIGGDSRIHYDQVGNLTAGPEKVVPLCLASSKWANLNKELSQYRKPENYELFSACETDCYFAGRHNITASLNDFERKIIKCLSAEAHSLFFLSEQFDVDPDALHLDSLVKNGYAQCISFTPTDLLHVTGKYVMWDREISSTAADIMAAMGKCETGDFLQKCEEVVNDHLIFSSMQSIANFEKNKFDFRESNATRYLINSFLHHGNPYMNVDFRITKPIVAIGAPAGSWMPAVAEKLQTKLVIPPDYEVASAVGVAVADYASERRGI